jgi:hypothetical protein
LPNHIPIILDKSALQSLTKSEAEWLFHHFIVNLPPVFFAELVADLHKDPKKTTTGSPDNDVRMLANKVVSHEVYINSPPLRNPR